MFSGVYGYLFGEEENSNDSICSQENAEPCSVSYSEDGWCIVDESVSGRSSPVVVPEPEVRDIDTLSFSSRKSFKPISEEKIRRKEELRAARAANVVKMHLERMLFEEVADPMVTSSSRVQKSSLASAAKLKRSTVATMMSTDAKTKSRSKKAVKTPANRNNNRKCQNLD